MPLPPVTINMMKTKCWGKSIHDLERTFNLEMKVGLKSVPTRSKAKVTFKLPSINFLEVINWQSLSTMSARYLVYALLICCRNLSSFVHIL
mmetsp:Transcript_26024/g.48894  ORF Transcript_26024/g.48894 Transcript_26024/m.48894 type:complete len:91 (-) Transcript_26024:138-410(-)